MTTPVSLNRVPLMRRFSPIAIVAFPVILMMTGVAATAQTNGSGKYFPLDHRVPGMASRWAQTIHPPCEAYVQPVKIELPSRGLVTFFNGAPENAVLTQAPSQAGMIVGHTYRLRISGVPELPGVELFPTIELLDRLHPPPGQEQEFPIPIQLTVQELAAAADDQLVTKVVYLEQPQYADPKPVDDPLRVTSLPAHANLLEAADRRGRAMAIVRIGGRTPSLHDPNDRHFFGASAPVIPQASMVTPPTESVADNARSVTFGPLAAE